MTNISPSLQVMDYEKCGIHVLFLQQLLQMQSCIQSLAEYSAGKNSVHMNTIEGKNRGKTYIASGAVNSEVSAGHNSEIYGRVNDIGTGNDEIIDIRTSQFHNSEMYN